MKKMFFLAATAALALSSCSSDELVQGEQPVGEDGAVNFEAYSVRSTRTATDVTELSLKQGGFGVFAYDQGAKDFSTFSSTSSYPNFMFNQKVQGYTSGNVEMTSSSDAAAFSKWSYKPVKYYNNNVGAKHSFFAYAPHNKDINAVFALGANPAIRYNAADIEHEYDLMYAQSYVDMAKPGVSHKIAFDFKHALSKVNVYVAPFLDVVHGTHSTTYGTFDGNTKVILRSVKFVGTLASQALLDLGTGNWTYESTEESAYELNGSIDVTNNTTATADNPGTYEHVMDNRMVIPTRSGDKIKVQVIYDVITTDPKAAEKGTANNSTITNKITSVEEFTFEKGKAYSFFLDLGLTSVQFKAKVDDWVSDTQNVDMPNNNHWHPVYPVVLSTTSITGTSVTEKEFSSKSDTGVEYYTDTHKIYSDGTQVTIVSNYVANSKLYTVAAGGGVTVSAPEYVKAGESIYAITNGGTAISSTATLHSLNVNSKGQIEVDTAGGWTNPTPDAYYSFGGRLYQWRTAGD